MLDKILYIPDVHRPYNDKKAWKLVMTVAKDFKPDTLVLLGDFADFYTVSKFSKNPFRATQLDIEVQDCNVGLDELDTLGASEKLFIEGNHCFRLVRYLQDRAPALAASLNVQKLFNLRERGWKFIPYRQHIKHGKIYLTHDIGTCTRHAAFKALDTFQHSVVTAHTHRMIYVVENDATGVPILSAQFGWLGDVTKVDYKHRISATKDWALGFGIGYKEKGTGLVFTSPVPIVNYKCVVNGKLYKV